MNPIHMLLPVCALAFLTIFVLLLMARRRMHAAKNREVDVTFYQRYDDGREPDAPRFAARNLANLFETPVLFYVACIVTYVTSTASWWLVALAWLYVVLRCAHTYVHVTANVVRLRFRLFVLSFFVLVGIWILVALNLLRAL